jgi:hypothetical protein
MVSAEVELPVETRAFVPVEGGSVIASGYVLSMASFDELAFGPNHSGDVVILKEMGRYTVVEGDEEDDTDDVNVFLCKYEGIHSGTHVIQDSGMLAIETPAEEKLLGASGVVGFFRKQGAWVRRPGAAVDTTIGNQRGKLRYSSLEAIRSVEMELDVKVAEAPVTISGSSTVQVVGTDLVQLAAWSALEGQVPAFQFSMVSLARKGDAYSGLIRRLDDEVPESWQSRYALMRVWDKNDSDGDGVPDLSEIGADAIAKVLEGKSLGGEWFWSDTLDTMVRVDAVSGWWHADSMGWFLAAPGMAGDNTKFYVPDPRIGWVSRADASSGGLFCLDSDGTMVVFEALNGVPGYRDQSGTGEWRALRVQSNEML